MSGKGLSRGKQFEQKFAEDFRRTFPVSLILRLPDQQSGYYGTSRNICDFICYTSHTLFLIECKSVSKASFPFTNLTQYDRLLRVKRLNIPGVRIGVVVWFIEKDKVVYLPIDTIRQLKDEGKKSVGIKLIAEGKYNIINIPSTKKRVFMESDYSVLLNNEEDTVG